jgi:hypothetical protein
MTCTTLCSCHFLSGARLEFANTEEERKFAHCRAPVSRGVWLAWRVFQVLYFAASIFYSVYYDNHPHTWITSATHWMLCLEALYNICYLCVCVHDKCSALIYTTWVLSNTVAPGSIFVCGVYWGLVYSAAHVYPNQLNEHGVNTFMLLVDLLIAGIPFRFLHCWCLGVFAIVYILFTTAYFELAHAYVYAILNFAHPVQSVVYVLLLGFVAIPLCCLIAWAFKRTGHYFFDGQQTSNYAFQGDGEL